MLLKFVETGSNFHLCIRVVELLYHFFLRLWLFPICPSWERDPSHAALSEVSTFYPVKRVFCSFPYSC